MICVFDKTASDFTNNGLGLVLPTECTITETLNGIWELTMKHPLDVDGKWQRLRRGSIIRVPVPAAMTPAIAVAASPAETKEIWRVSTNGGRLHLRRGTGTKYKIIGKYKNSSQVVVLKKTTSSWYEAIAPDGKRGFMSASYLRYVRTETVPGSAEREVVEPNQLRDQPFRIYRIVPGLDGITVYARHLFYDLLDNFVREYSPKEAIGSTVASNVLSKCANEHPFSMFSDLDTIGSAEWTNANPIDMLLGDAGLLETWRGELARDWYDVYAVKRVGRDSGVTVRQGKNITGLTVDEDESSVATRIVPVGQDKDGKPLYLPEVYLDSPHIAEYANIKWRTLDVSEAKEVVKGDEKMTKAQCYAKMREATQAEFDAGCDLPDITIAVDFVNLPDTVEGKELAVLNHIFLGDTVHVFAERLGVAIAMRMTDYTYDCIGRRYTKMSLGTVANGLESVTISAKQLGSTSIPGSKLMLGSVGTGQLKDLAVDTAKIQIAAIGTAHIQDAAITRVKIGDAEIGSAQIEDAAITRAKIGSAAIGSAQIEDATITGAKIADATITGAKIEKATITGAEIKDASIGTAQIAHGSITTALINEGVVGEAQIADASITDAKIMELSASKLTAGVIDAAEIEVVNLKAANITVGTINGQQIAPGAVDVERLAEGAVTSEKLAADSVKAGTIAANAVGAEAIAADTILGEHIHGETITGDKLVMGAITANKLGANSVTAEKITANAVTAAKINVDSLFAAEAFLNKLNAADISANKSLEIYVRESDQRLYLRFDKDTNTITLGRDDSDVLLELLPGENAGLYIKQNGLTLAQFARTLATVKRLEITDAILFPNHVMKAMGNGDLAILAR